MVVEGVVLVADLVDVYRTNRILKRLSYKNSEV